MAAAIWTPNAFKMVHLLNYTFYSCKSYPSYSLKYIATNADFALIADNKSSWYWYDKQVQHVCFTTTKEICVLTSYKYLGKRKISIIVCC